MSTPSAAQLQFDPEDAPYPETEAQATGGNTSQARTSALKMQAAERLAAHRARRDPATAGELAGPKIAAPAAAPPAETRAMRIAAAVAERYAQSQSYRGFLAAEAERATQQAEAAAEVAARTAQAVAATQQQLLSELESWTMGDAPGCAPLADAFSEMAGGSFETLGASFGAFDTSSAADAIAQRPNPGLTVRLYEDVGRGEIGAGYANAVPYEQLDEEERIALDDEIAFRQSPVFDGPREPAIPIPANLLEFPRQLVASRRARPRLAEGPLREEGDQGREGGQLRIFEVEADQIENLPEAEPTLPEWSSIRLGARMATESLESTAELASQATDFRAAPPALRLLSTMVDGSIVLAAFLGFTTVVSYTAGRLPTGELAALGSVVTLAALFLIYQLLFFTFSNATPGMRYTRIGLCSFSDENPTRSAMRRRLIAVILAACPLGLGFLWAFLDDDRLGWHDRISGMYQRSY